VAVVVVKQEPDTPEHASSPSALPLALPASRIDPIGGPPAEHTLQQQQQHHHHHLDAHRRLPALYQPSKAVPDALDRVFISHFVQRNNNSRAYYPEIPWITHLPNLHGRASKPAVRLSIRAASMAFYAVIHRDTTILVDSYRWYTMSLTCQRQSLARLGANSVPEAEEILVPIILSIYEVYAGTTTTSIWPHLEAAAKIIQLRGPANCTGIMSTLFKVMRVSDVSPPLSRPVLPPTIQYHAYRIPTIRSRPHVPTPLPLYTSLLARLLACLLTRLLTFFVCTGPPRHCLQLPLVLLHS